MASNEKNLQIQSLRGICALVVFLSHALNIYKSEIIEHLVHSPFHLFFDGHCAVMVFFVLSGYYAFHPKAHCLKDSFRKTIKKLIRLYVPHIVVIVFAVILINSLRCNQSQEYLSEWASGFWKSRVHLNEFIAQCSILLPRDPDLINPPSWYLTTEVKMTLLLPFVYSLVRWINKPIVLLFAFPALIVLNMPYLGWPIGVYVLGGWLNAKREGITRRTITLMNKTVCRNSRFICGLLFYCFLIVALFLLNIQNELTINKSIAYCLETIGVALIMILCLNIKMRALNDKLLICLGNMSLEFYLVHFIVLMTVSKLLFLSLPLFVLLTVSISIVLATVTKRFVSERVMSLFER